MRHIAPMAVRIPSDLKDRLEAAAVHNKRSLNSELVYRLEASFESPLRSYLTAELIAELVLRQKVTGIQVAFTDSSETHK